MVKSIFVENIKCTGCEKSIKSELSKIIGVGEIEVNNENGEVSFAAIGQAGVNKIIAKLSRMGYPQVGEGNIIHQAKSYVSCAIGRTLADPL